MTDADLRLLDEYRRSFGEVYESVVATIRSRLHLEPTGRPAKSTTSIVEKLKRESIRLVQMQDIAGCRVVIGDAVEQERVVTAVTEAFAARSIVDRRTEPSYGYRAVHVVVEMFGKSVEVQIRTSLQHSWAELSEKLSDTVDPNIKYGGGPLKERQFLDFASKLGATIERVELETARVKSAVASAPEEAPDELKRTLIELEQILSETRDLLKTEMQRFR